MYKRIFQYCGLLLVLTFSFLSGVNAQKKRNKDVLQTQSIWASHIEVDGNLEEWKDDSLFSLHGEEFKYQIRNDHENIYFAFEIDNKERQFQILSQGIQVSFNLYGSRKAIQSIRFPLADRNDFRELVSLNQGQNKDVRELALQSIRGIGVKGFDNLTDGLISLQNSFGIVAKSLLTEDGLLNVELKVPISLLKSRDHGTEIDNAMAINIKAHEFVNPPSRRNRGSEREGRRERTSRRNSQNYVVQYANTTGIWLELQLAKPTNMNIE